MTFKATGSRRCALAAGLTLALAALSTTASAADNRPIKMIVPFGAGSSVDTLARVVAERISHHLGTSIVIDNRAGAGGGVGASSAAQTAPDGTNLFFGTAGTHGINPALYKKLGYDPVKDFEPIIGITTSSNVMVVDPKLGFKSLADFVARAKANPGTLTMGSGGNGTTPHLSGVLLNRAAGIETTHVPYKSGAMIDVIAGRLNYSFESVPSAVPFIKSGQVQALAVTASKREPMLKEVPTIAESGYPGYEVMAWVAIFAPRGSSKDFISRVNEAANKALAEPDLVRRLGEIGGTPIGGTPEDLRKRVATELARWPEVIRAANITLD
jgi:tripartite-type tricarboxylate transporter receptor subunit TctC